MKGKKEKEEDQFIGDLLKSTPLVKAPGGFTDAVMKHILDEEYQALQYKPLIARWVWYVLGALGCLVAVISGSGKLQWSSENAVSTYLDSALEQLPLFRIPLPELSGTLLYGLLAFSVFAILHLYWMKRHIQRQFH